MIDASDPNVAIALIITTIASILILFKIKQLNDWKNNVAMKGGEFQKFPLLRKETLSHDTKRLTFGLQTPQTRLGLPIGQHIAFRFFDKDQKVVQRSYTPVTGNEILGEVSFVIKVYKAGIHPKFPEGGKMSQHVDSLKIGDTLEMKGPKGHLTYFGKGNFSVKPLGKPLTQRKAQKIGMIAGGTGITPMLQIINAVLRDSGDRTSLSLIFANQTEEDILLRKELDTIAKDYPKQFKVHYTLDRPPANWNYSQGFVTKEMIQKYLPGPDDSTQIFMCGPPPMIKFACLPSLQELGFTENQWAIY